MASSKPVIASREGGPIEIVDDGVTGILVPPGRHHRLAREILSVIRDPARAQRLGEAGRARAEERFQLREQVRIVETAYGAALAG
jgi:glycosyltransferase involved in cell wall biosynthesis